MRKLGVGILYLYLIGMLMACSSSERVGDRATRVSTVKATSWSAVNLVFALSDRFLRGDGIAATEARSGTSVLYPAADGAMLVGAIIGHAFVGRAISEARKVERDADADKILSELDVLVKSIDRDVFASRVAHELQEQMDIRVLVGGDQDATRPTFMTKPFFSLSQNRDYLAVENLIEISERPNGPSYTNRIHLISPKVDLSELERDQDTQFFAATLMALYTLTNEIALLDASGVLSSDIAEEQTYRVGMGGSFEYQRAKYVRDIEGFGVLEVLGGNLLLVPKEQISRL